MDKSKRRKVCEENRRFNATSEREPTLRFSVSNISLVSFGRMEMLNGPDVTRGQDRRVCWTVVVDVKLGLDVFPLTPVQK